MPEQEKKTTTEESSPSPSSTATSTTATAESKTNQQKKKSTMLKIRGFLTGKSRREKRKDREAKKKTGAKKGETSIASDGKSKVEGDDQSTVYGVDVDDGSTNANNPAALAAKKNLLKTDGEDDEETDLFNENEAAEKKYLLKVVLLLMDAKSRRFELLQLEFDSVKATVSDVLAQIPIAVTEECLQKQTYEGITCCDGKEKNSDHTLAEFCKGGDVMVAIAEGMTAAECVKLALPILGDSKVMAMLKASGIDSSPWKEAKKQAKLNAKREKEQADEENKPTAQSATKSSPESAPVKSSPVKSSSNKKIAPTENTEKVDSKARGAAVEAEKPAESKDDSDTPVITFHPNRDAAAHSSIPQEVGIHVSEVHRTSPRASKSGSSVVKTLIAIAILALIGALVKVADMYLSAPIAIGQVLTPGTVLHKCGVAGFVPGLQNVVKTVAPQWDCENSYLVVEDNRVTGYDKDGDVTWIIQGTPHADKKFCDVDNEEDCKRGLHYKDDKHLIVSGTKITWIEVFQTGVELHPWPFEEKPLARTWRK